jgi:hypothetical protein
MPNGKELLRCQSPTQFPPQIASTCCRTSRSPRENTMIAIRAVPDHVEFSRSLRGCPDYRPYLPLFCDPEGAKPATPAPRVVLVRYRRRGTDAAGYRKQCSGAGRVGHAFALPPQAGACHSMFEHPPRCRARSASALSASSRLPSRWCLQRGNECAFGLQSSPYHRYVCVMLSVHSPYRMPAPVDRMSLFR